MCSKRYNLALDQSQVDGHLRFSAARQPNQAGYGRRGPATLVTERRARLFIPELQSMRYNHPCTRMSRYTGMIFREKLPPLFGRAREAGGPDPGAARELRRERPDRRDSCFYVLLILYEVYIYA